MESCNTFSALELDLPRITHILRSILSDPITGMRRGGIRGIRDILNTGIILSDSILNGADTRLVSTMTRIFIIGTIVARGEVGTKDPMALVPKEAPVLAIVPKGPPVLAFVPKEAPVLAIVPKEAPVQAFVPKELPVLAFVPKGPPVLTIVPKEPPVQAFVPKELPVLAFVPKGPPVLHFLLKPRLPAVVNLGHLLILRKNISSSSPTGASSQIALPRAIWDHFESEIKVSLV